LTNLFAKHNCRAADGDEREKVGPEVAVVIGSLSFSCNTEWLARAGAGPDWKVIGPAGEADGIRPARDASEEMTLGK
jgi:hypothetical protein